MMGMHHKAPPPIVSVAFVWVLLMVAIALLADQITPYDFKAMDLRNRLVPPAWMARGTWQHALGTDDLGRDMLARLIESIRISLAVAFLGTLIGAVFGTSLGLIAARFRGWVDEAVQLAVDFQAALPFLILALAVLTLFTNTLTLFVIVMGFHGWERYARLARGLALSAREQGYAIALDLLGASSARIYLLHILPNIASALIVNMTISFPETVLLETSLSFLGLGIQPPMTSLGNMVGFGRDFLLSAWWIALFPAVVIFVTTLAFGILGDWLRDTLDPVLKES